ncbi:hypothetical protein A3841_16570 [Pontibacter flavimaris]|uniref:Uncharacterized protein n=1 Tax=Pontibacter flavimaris TaxID=1797110 RepID=A0A1Q5PCL0_9BACT|nr:hypothetical protein A3841_16570 [Pontibacter flavimaris]
MPARVFFVYEKLEKKNEGEKNSITGIQEWITKCITDWASTLTTKLVYNDQIVAFIPYCYGTPADFHTGLLLHDSWQKSKS